MRPQTRLKRQTGYTLLEIIISTVLLGILAMVGSSVIYDNVRTGVLVNKGQATADQGRYVLERIAREVREMHYYMDNATPGTAGSYAVTSSLSPNATSLVFKRPTSGSITTLRDVALCFSGATVSLTYDVTACPATPTGVLTDQATSLNLNFYDGDGLATNSALLLRSISVDLHMKDTTGSGQVINQRLRIALRNL